MARAAAAPRKAQGVPQKTTPGGTEVPPGVAK